MPTSTSSKLSLSPAHPLKEDEVSAVKPEDITETSEHDPPEDDAETPTSPSPDENATSGGTEETDAPNTDVTTAAAAVAPNTDWQAIYSPAHNAYYFFNAKTQQTTWTNPLVPSEAAGSSPPQTNGAGSSSNAALYLESPGASTSSSRPLPQKQDDPYGGIDPELAFLDPSLAYATSKGSTGATPVFAAKFHARSGRFTAADGRDPNHVSEYERAKRMSEAYFDVDSWKSQVEEREAAKKRAAEEEELGGVSKKKRPSKADLERYKAQKQEKKMKKNAWLRE